MKLDRCIVSGLHSSGKSYFLTNVASSSHRNMVRLDVLDMMKNIEFFNMDFYLNMFSLYDRFLPIDCCVYHRYSSCFFEQFMKKLKEPYKNSIFILLLFKFNGEMHEKDIIEISMYEKLIQIMRRLDFNVMTFRNKQEWLDWSSSAKMEFADIDRKLFNKTNIKELHEMVNIVHDDAYIRFLSDVGVTKDDITWSDEYERYQRIHGGHFVDDKY